MKYFQSRQEFYYGFGGGGGGAVVSACGLQPGHQMDFKLGFLLGFSMGFSFAAVVLAVWKKSKNYLVQIKKST